MIRKKFVNNTFQLLIIFISFVSCEKSINIDNYEFYDSIRKTRVKFYYKKNNNKIIYHGKYISTNINGKIIKEYNFNNGKLSGEQIRRFDNGNLMAKVYYKNGLKNGYEDVFYENGKKKFERKYLNNKLILEEINFYENGMIENFNFYDNKGDLVFYIDFDKKGFVSKKEGLLIHCFNNKIIKKRANATYFGIMYPNIKNATRSISFLYNDKRIGKRNLKKMNKNFLLVEEMSAKKGNNLLNVIAEYKFDKKYHNQILRDTFVVQYFAE